MARSQRWTRIHDDMQKWWHKTTGFRNGVTLPKAVDATLAWKVNRDLHSIHTSEYRREDDAEIREAVREARAAVRRLADLLWDREQRQRRR